MYEIQNKKYLIKIVKKKKMKNLKKKKKKVNKLMIKN